MPIMVRYYVRAAIIYFILALLAGLLMSVPGRLSISQLRPVYFHLLVVGWVTQLIMGVSYWMFPRYSKESPRGNETLGWAAFGLLNVGMLLRAIGEPLTGSVAAGWLLSISALMQLAAGWLFVIIIWPRVKER